MSLVPTTNDYSADPMERARALLLQHYGFEEFRAPQVRIVGSVLAGQDTLAILPTGGGKSVCFQIPALVLSGFTIVISPLISLMQDQVAAAQGRGIAAAALNSSLTRKQQERVLTRLSDGETKLLYLSPERLKSIAATLGKLPVNPALLAVDEAHCIVEWGADFRPSYRLLQRARRLLGWPPCVALTGSATPEVRAQIIRGLGLGVRRPLLVQVGSFDRRNLWFGVIKVSDDQQRWKILLDLLRSDDCVAIIYAPTRKIVEGLSRSLCRMGFRSAPYHARLNRELREQTLQAFLDDRLQVVVATCAFGMGIDKPNVRLVIHWSMPATPESYYQEAGRAGRDGAPARCILLYHPSDAATARQQLTVTFPDEELVESLWTDPVKRSRTPENIVLAVERLKAELRPERGRVDWRPVRARRQAAVARIEAVVSYAITRKCRRQALLKYFGEEITRCTGCDRCGQPRVALPHSPDTRARIKRIMAELSRVRAGPNGVPIDPVTIRRIAESAPSSITELAGIPGLSNTVLSRFGAIILRAVDLGGSRGSTPLATPAHLDSGYRALEAWRHQVAQDQGVPIWQVAPDSLLRRIWESRPITRKALSGIPEIGPRFINKYSEPLLAILKDSRRPD